MNDTPTAAPMRDDAMQTWEDAWDALPDGMHAYTRARQAGINALGVARAARHDAADGYTTAFYEIATMLGIGARAASPADMWRDQMRPKLEALTKSPSAVVRPSDETLDGFLPESVRAEKRCGIQRSAWLSGWYVPWSPRNDNENAEGPWSHWVALAHEILKADAKAIAAAASPVKETSRFDPPGLWESEPRSSADDAGEVQS